MTLVDKELKSSKEESILHFKRVYERSLATAIGRFSDDRHQGLVYLRADKKNRCGKNSPIDWTYMFHYSACILRMTVRDRRISFLSISRQYMKYSSRLVFCLSSYILVRSSSSLEDRSITLIIQGYNALALLVYRQNICPISEQYWDFLRRLWPASNNLHLLIQLSWRLCTDCYFRYCSIYHIICKYSNYMIYWWINIKFKSNSSDINYYNPYLNKHYLRRYIQSIWYSISYKYPYILRRQQKTQKELQKLIMAGEKRISQKKILAYRKITHL